MKLIVCIEERNGILFNGRRLSLDRKQREDVRQQVQGPLYMSAYTAKLYADIADCHIISLSEALACAVWYVLEEPFTAQQLRVVDEILLYQWNRRYPFDTTFPPLEDEWECIACERFAGSSHEAIDRMHYSRRKE